MACFRLLTLPPFPPRPERSVPFFRRRMALSTRLEAALPYLRLEDDFFLVVFLRDEELFFRERLVLEDFFLAAIDPSW